MEEKFTIHDIARILNVSPSTVSRALNDNPRISANMRKEVQLLAQQYGYSKNNLATSLRRGQSMTAGVIIPRITRYFFSSVIGGMEEVLRKAGYNLMICQTQESYSKEIKNLKTLMDMQVDVIFISLSAETTKSDHIREIIQSGKKIIMFDRVDESLDIEMAKLNDYQGAFNTVDHMLKQGYRKIVHFSGPDNLSVYQERKNGYLDALRKNNINYFAIIDDVITKEKGREAMDALVNSNNMPDGIFAASDYSALGALLSAREHKISVPEQFGIAGFANEPFTEFIHPGITSTDQKAEIMGKKIAGMFLENPKGNKNHQEIIDPELIIRNSTLKQS